MKNTIQIKNVKYWLFWMIWHEKQGEKQIKVTEEHGKQLAESNALIRKDGYDIEKDSPEFSK